MGSEMCIRDRNTYTTPFLAQKPPEKRAIIEQLLGITLLSEKAERLQAKMKITKDAIKHEEITLGAISKANEHIQTQLDSMIRRQKVWEDKKTADCANLEQEITNLKSLDIEQEIANHNLWAQYTEWKNNVNSVELRLAQAQKEYDRESEVLARLYDEMCAAEKNICYACSQTVKDGATVAAQKQTEMEKLADSLVSLQEEIKTIIAEYYQLGEQQLPPKTWYTKVEYAVLHRTNLESKQQQLSMRQAEDNPYTDQIQEMSSQAFQNFDYSNLNALKKTQEHEEFLLKLLTNKDSFIRKKIIDQSLTYLNSRLQYYLSQMGLPHIVTFQNDLEVCITVLGLEFDFDALSRGERNRVILAMNWSFRDVWENLYQKINFLFIDEMIDNGMDSAGVDSAIGVLKHMVRDGGRSVWLVSHRDELLARVKTVVKAVKENGYTNFCTAE